VTLLFTQIAAVHRQVPPENAFFRATFAEARTDPAWTADMASMGHEQAGDLARSRLQEMPPRGAVSLGAPVASRTTRAAGNIG
jgi:hypothetical protein